MIPEHFIRGRIETVTLELADKSIYENLVDASKNKKIIQIIENQQRVIGKTTALIKFAKDNGYYVLVGSDNIARMLIRYSGYKRIRSIDSRSLDSLSGIVVDECCSREKIQKLIDHGQLVVTGFVK